jgi:multidrug transporter EmrE-like cation transporter
LSEKQKIKKILENLKTQFDDRREYDEKICGNSLEDLKEWTKTFVSQQSKVELSQIFGAHAYEKLSEAINLFAKEVAGTEEFFEKSLSTIRVSRHLLDSQIKRKWIEISMDVVSIAAQALCIAFPVMTIPTIMVYTLWSSYGVMMAALKLIDKSDEKFLARQIEKAIPTVQLKEIEKFENELMNDSAFQSIESLAKNPIANNLLKVRTFEKFKKVASKRMLEKIAKEMKVLLHEAKVPDVRIKKTAFNSIKDLRNAFLKYRDLFITNNGSIVNKAESLRQQIVILNNINDAFYEKVLKIKMRNL